MEVPERLRPVAVVDEAVERGEERRAVGYLAVTGGGMGVEAAPLEADAECLEPLLVVGTLGFRERQRLGLGVPALGEVPEPVVGRSRARRGGGAP